MASGGSTPPTHLSIPKLSSGLLASSSDTLQTPKLTLTPVTNLSLPSSAGDNGGKSFTSLEELLNITGINSPTSDYKSSTTDNGVTSLSKIAQAVENNQQGSSEQAPPAKKPRLDSTSTNIRVQPLTNVTHLTSSTPSQPSATIASLLHKKQTVGSNHVGPNTTSTMTLLGANSSTSGTLSSLIGTLASGLNSVSSSGANSSTNATGPPSIAGNSLSSKASGLGTSLTSGIGGANSMSLNLGQTGGVAKSNVSTQPQAMPSQTGPVSSPSSVIPSLMQPSASNPKSFLLQLVQLFKHYQNIGDNDGMNRIKKQLNVLVSASQVRNQSNPLLGALSILTNMSTPNATGSSSNSASTTIGLTSTSLSTAQTGSTTSQTGLTSSRPQTAPVSRPPSQPVPPSLLTNTQRTSSVKPLTSIGVPGQVAATSGVSVSAGKVATSLPTASTSQGVQSTALSEQLSIQQKAVKQLQSIMASLPAANRPKTAQEIRDFVQKYSSLISQLQTNSMTATTQSKALQPTQKSTLTAEPPKTTIPGPVVVPLNFGTGATTSAQSSVSNSAMAQVDQHFQTALTAAKIKSALSTNLPSKALPASQPAVVDLTKDGDSSGTVSAPVTTQFKGGVTATGAKATAESGGAKPGGIQAGVATPLPPGLTLETLAVLCRLPESELEKLKLPVGLLSAIKVWKEKQPAKKGPVTQTKGTSSNSNIPVLFPPSSTQTTPLTKAPLTLPSHLKNPAPMKVGDAVSLTSQSGDMKKPFVIPGTGFPPRSLHAYVASGQNRSGLTTASKVFATTATPGRNLSRPNSHHMTRYRTKADQERAEKERIQALTKALQSSEEARIAFRFSAHLDKMHSQLLAPDTTSPFNNKQDILARLLPYHVYAECEPPPAAVEKADAVFESVAQVLLSRSRGLQSRFQQLLAKSDSQGGGEHSVMEMELDRRFIETEHERIQQEKLEKKQAEQVAEQVAADLSLMVKADGIDTFDSEFSLSDAFFPFLDNGIT